MDAALKLDRAADVDEALELLGQYDLHASMRYMVHFAIADKTGRSVAAEYIGNEMTVLETPILTNFYLAEGEKNGVGTRQSHRRFEILQGLLEEKAGFTEAEVRDALSSVSKGNFGEFESTEWSIVMNLSAGTARYYHREDYRDSYYFVLKGARQGEPFPDLMGPLAAPAKRKHLPRPAGAIPAKEAASPPPPCLGALRLLPRRLWRRGNRRTSAARRRPPSPRWIRRGC